MGFIGDIIYIFVVFAFIAIVLFNCFVYYSGVLPISEYYCSKYTIIVVSCEYALFLCTTIGMGRLPDGTLNPSVVYSSYMRQRPVPHKSIYATGSSSSTTTATASDPSSTTTPTTPACTTTTTTDSSTNTSSSTATPSTTTPTSSGTTTSTTSSSHKSAHPASTVVTEPMPIEKEAANYLRSEGVQRVVVGHQPVGDAPLYMQAHGVQVIV